MHIKAKLYPYPVLTTFNNDYISSSFDIDVEANATEEEITLQFLPKLENSGLMEIIKNNDAIFVVHIESSYASYRKIVEVPIQGCTIKIEAEHVTDLINICPFIIADRDIYEYSNDKFNEDYVGIKFNLDKGNILAIGKEKTIRIEKENDELISMPSIFVVTEIIDKNKKDMIIDYSGDKIIIKIPTKAYKKFALLNSNNLPAQSVLHSMIIIPALIQALDEVKYSNEEYFLYEDRRWYKAVRTAALKQNIVINEQSIKTFNTFNLAQCLMENTTIKGIENLSKVGDDSYEN